MMGIVVPETYWAYKKYNKIISGILVGFYSSVKLDVFYVVCRCVFVGILRNLKYFFNARIRDILMSHMIRGRKVNWEILIQKWHIGYNLV